MSFNKPTVPTSKPCEAETILKLSLAGQTGKHFTSQDVTMAFLAHGRSLDTVPGSLSQRGPECHLLGKGSAMCEHLKSLARPHPSFQVRGVARGWLTEPAPRFGF